MMSHSLLETCMKELGVRIPILKPCQSHRSASSTSPHGTMLDFTFTVATINEISDFANGIAFLLPPTPLLAVGECLGLRNSFITVDPPYDDPDKPSPHVEINFNSTISVNTMSWWYSIIEGQEVELLVAVREGLVVVIRNPNNLKKFIMCKSADEVICRSAHNT